LFELFQEFIGIGVATPAFLYQPDKLRSEDVLLLYVIFLVLLELTHVEYIDVFLSLIALFLPPLLTLVQVLTGSTKLAVGLYNIVDSGVMMFDHQ
jgi:hypothetical protein